MYEAHFGLKEHPFGLTPDTSFFYGCTAYQEALNTLLIAAQSGEGFIKVTGEVGTGKTMLCRKFLDTLDARFITAFIPNPYISPETLLLALADELKVKLPAHNDPHQTLKAINRALIAFANEQKSVLVLLDEAQAMPLETLESLRLLTNLETEKRKLLQVVLFGQPELNAKLRDKSVRQLAQRITFQYELPALSGDEVHAYLDYRLHIAGYRGGPLFALAAVHRLHRAGRGIPRLINILAHKALMLAYGEGRQSITIQDIQAAARDTPAARQSLLTVLRACWPLKTRKLIA